MVALTQYATADVKTTGNTKVHIPDAKYPMVIIKSESKPAFSAGMPDDLVLTAVITQGAHKDVELEHRLSIHDTRPVNASKPEWTWQRAAYGSLGQIADALGMSTIPADSSQFHNKLLTVTTRTREGKDKDGTLKPEWNESQISKYEAAQSVAPAAGQPSFSSVAAPQVTGAPAPAPFSPAAAPVAVKANW